MTIYKLRKQEIEKIKEPPKEGDIKTEDNFTYQFIAGDWILIHYKEGDYESWQECNNKGNMIHYKNSNGFESWYNEKGQEITKEEFNRLWEKVEDDRT